MLTMSLSSSQGEAHSSSNRSAFRSLLLTSAVCLLIVAPLAAPLTATAQDKPAAPAASASAFAAEQTGLFTVQSDAQQAKVRITLPPAGADGIMARYLYQPGISAGLGVSNVGLDRSGLGQTQIIAFRRVGRRVLASFENNAFRAVGAGADERDAVAASFARSVVWSGEITSEKPDGSVQIDLTSFLERDALNVPGRLKRAGQGTYKPAPTLGYVDVASTGVFPDNVEFNTVQTFTSDEPGANISRITPDPRSVTLTVHHSFVRLPDADFQTRAHDPRTGTSVQVLVTDFAADLDQPVVSRLSRRFRLEKTDPTAERSTVKKPIVFYVDRGAPESIRKALIEGGNWWAAAFDKAGFIDAFRVELLPEGVDPMDVRYNIIAWVHRESRGWSTGSTVVDPRTGEIVRGVVQLGSLRDRQDQMIFQGLVGVAGEGSGAPDDPRVLVHQRLAHLAAHEIGHALGLSHNFAASTFADRASVMDYPAPWVKADGNRLDFSDAYTSGVGAWDRFVIQWLYDQAPKGQDEAARLAAYVADARARGFRFVADGDTRDVGNAQPYSAMWDNGVDPVAEFANVMAVRRIALSRFGLNTLPDGAPAADLQRVLVPIYLYHRYQAVAAGRLIGGVDYSYALKGDGDERAVVVPAQRQRAALDSLLTALTPATLDLPDSVLDLLSSAQSGTTDRQSEIELLPGRMAGVFDPTAAASTAADVVLEILLEPQRLNRLVEQSRRDPSQLTLTELFDRVSASVAPGGRLSPRELEMRRAARAVYVSRLTALANNTTLNPTTRAVVRDTARGFAKQLGQCRTDRQEAAQCAYLAALLSRDDFGSTAALEATDKTPTTPPGAPI